MFVLKGFIRLSIICEYTYLAEKRVFLFQFTICLYQVITYVVTKPNVLVVLFIRCRSKKADAYFLSSANFLQIKDDMRVSIFFSFNCLFKSIQLTYKRVYRFMIVKCLCKYVYNFAAFLDWLVCWEIRIAFKIEKRPLGHQFHEL